MDIIWGINKIREVNMINARIYNLYPYLLSDFEKWFDKLDDIAFMNFNWVYVNPFHLPGFSGSIYSIKNYYEYNPSLLKTDYETMAKDSLKYREEGDSFVKNFCEESRKRKINVMMDLVVNHTSIDSELIDLKPEWYEKNEDGTLRNPGALDGDELIIWGDLAQIDNENSSDKENLWKYWLDYVLYYAGLGIRGFRCDAAYQVTSSLWKYLISEVKKVYPDTIFLAETLSCTPEQILEIINSGFDLVMNSFKWWNFHDEWFLRDYDKWVDKCPSLTFPENHDTERFAKEYNGDSKKAVCYYAIGAYFCSGIAITLGFEYGFKNKINVVETTSLNYEDIEYNIAEDIRIINEIKSEYNILKEDNFIKLYDFNNENIFSFLKTSKDKSEKIFLIANINTDQGVNVEVPKMFEVMGNSKIEDISHGHRMDEVPDNFQYYLQPGEVKLFYLNLM